MNRIPTTTPKAFITAICGAFILLAVLAGVVDVRLNSPYPIKEDSVERPQKGACIVIYARNSAIGQENSVEDQLKVLRQEAADNGWIVVGTYIDADKSGATVEGRPEVQRLIRDAERGDFECVNIYDISRGTRGGSEELWPLVRDLRRHKVRLYNHHRRQFVNNKNAIFATIDACQAEEENKKRSKDCTRTSLLNVTERERDPGRQAPYGFDQLRSEAVSGKPVERIRYMPDGRKLVMDPEGKVTRRVLEPGVSISLDSSLVTTLVHSTPERVAIVRRIFRAAKIHGMPRIANELNEELIPGPRGPHWGDDTLYDLIRNPAYYGARAYGRTTKSRYNHVANGKIVEYDDFNAGKLNQKRVPMAEWIIQEGAHEPIVTKQQYLDAQEAAKERGKYTARNRKAKNQQREYMLGNFTECIHCERRLHGHAPESKGKLYITYKHKKRVYNGRECPNFTLPAIPMENFVMEALRPLFAGDAFMGELRDRFRDELQRHMALFTPTNGDEEARLKKERGDIAEAVRTITDSLVSNPLVMGMMKPELERLAVRGAEIERALQRMRPAPGKAEIEGLVKDGMKFYADRVIGPLHGATVAGNPAVEGQGSPEGKGDGPEHRQDRAGVAELKTLFRLLNLRIPYDPIGKEGWLSVSPFRQYATG